MSLKPSSYPILDLVRGGLTSGYAPQVGLAA
jgi:hypothetical protein